MTSNNRRIRDMKNPPKALEGYALRDCIGHGSFAKVYAARNLETNEKVAVKVIPLRRKFDSAELELAAFSKLSEHQNIVRLLSHTKDENAVYLIMEYLPRNRDLGVLLKHGTAWSEQEVMLIFKQVARAIQHCHAHKICHHDIKPENVILTSRRRMTVKLIDFGLAVHHPDVKAKCERFGGSPLYLAPEVLNGKPHDPYAAEMWSLGVLLYELLCRTTPWNGSNLSELVEDVNNSPLRFRGTGFSRQAANLIASLLDKDPNARLTIREVLAHPWLKAEDHSSDSSTDADDF